MAAYPNEKGIYIRIVSDNPAAYYHELQHTLIDTVIAALEPRQDRKAVRLDKPTCWTLIRQLELVKNSLIPPHIVEAMQVASEEILRLREEEMGST